MTRDPLTALAIRRETLLAEAKDRREARDMAGAAKAEAELRDVNREILKRGRGNA